MADDPNYREGLKLQFELLKHVTTLSTGTLLLVAIFVDKVFTSPVWKTLIAVAFVVLFLSVISSLFSMCMAATLVTGSSTPDASDRSKAICLILGLLFAAGMFLIGMGCIAVFVVKNFLG